MIEELDCTIAGNLDRVIASHLRDIEHVMCADLSPVAQQMASQYIYEKGLRIQTTDNYFRPKVRQ